MKRGVAILSILLLVLAPGIFAVEPSITISPLGFYETNDIDFQVNVSNWQGDYEIKELRLNLNPVTPLQLVDYKGWTESSYDTMAIWSLGSIATNVYLSIFELLAEAPRVDEDTESEVTVTLIDDVDGEHEFTFPISILNDVSPPELSDYIPVDGGQVREGLTDQPVQLRAVDPETGIGQVLFDYVLCDFEGNLTPEEHSVELSEDDVEEGLFTDVVDISDYDDMDVICFSFSAENNGGETSTYGGRVTVDGTAPQVFLVAPDEGDLVGLSDEFSFYADDNLASVMTCNLIVDGEVSLGNIDAPDMDTVQIPSAEVEEGQHTWSVSCLDQVGWQGDSEQRTYTLDKTPPGIVLTAPENGSVVADSVELQFEVSDNYQLESVSWQHGDDSTDLGDQGSFSVSIAEWPEGPNEVTVTASDHVGNTAVKVFTVMIDRTAPEIVLASPEDNSTTDVHVNFAFTAQDNYDDSLDCTLSVDSTGHEVLAVSGELATYEMLLAVGDYDWNVQCVDDAGNLAESEYRSVEVIDLTGPDVTMNNPDVVFRGDPIGVRFTVTDISGVEAVTAVMRDPDLNVQTISLEKDAETYTAIVPTYHYSTLGIYTLEVNAVDTLDNSNSAEDTILLTYKYIVDLTLDPGTVSPSGTVLASGTVVMDDGSAVPETEATLMLPVDAANSVPAVVSLANGSFMHTFAAPASDGAYDVSVSVLSAENGQAYTGTKALTVSTPAPVVTNTGGGGGGGGGSNHNTVDLSDTGGCNTEWRCTAWSPCSGGKQSRTCVDVNHCSDEDGKRIEKQSCTEKIEITEDEDEPDTTGNAVIETRREVQEPEEYTFNETEEDTGDSAGIGSASGFLNLGTVGLVKMLLVMLMMAMLLGTLKKYGGAAARKRRRKPAPQDVLSGKDKLGLEDYLDKRNNR
ncbi:TPA: thrombospondin type-1 domain-containing protein [Candidatus Woesearchaeota archaeon]|nr:thrombospondin type-1 domain-containing protein [Candidatus Woesearchaeota archaeon]